MHRPHTVDQSTVPTPAAFPRASRCRATQAARIPPRRERPAPILPSRPMTSHPTPIPPRGDRRVSTNSRRPTGTQARTKAATGVEPLPRRHPPNPRPQREKNGAEREEPAPTGAGHRPEHQPACPSHLVRKPVSRGAHRAHLQGVPPRVGQRLTERLKRTATTVHTHST